MDVTYRRASPVSASHRYGSSPSTSAWAAGTVARAHHELELAGRVRTSRGGGTRVVAPEPRGASGRRELAAPAEAYVRAGRRLGASDQELIAAVRAVIDGAPG